MLPVWNTYPGTLGSVVEGSAFTYPLSFMNPELGAIQVNLISGQLPPGLSINDSGLIYGDVDNISIEKTYYFTVRLENTDGIVDRSFSINVTNVLPMWEDPSVLGTVSYYSFYEYQFFILNLGGVYQRFEKISGQLPPGLELMPNGKLSGIIQIHNSDTLYSFTIRGYLDNGFIDKTFSINVSVGGNRPPIINDPSGSLGDIFVGDVFQFQFSAGDPDLTPVTFSAVGLPPGLNISSSGLLSGILTDPTPVLYTFSVKATDGFLITSKTFTLNANDQIISPITWVTESGSLGDILEGDKSIFSVKAESSSIWLRYSIEAGSLPNGLVLDINTGDISGRVLEQVSSNTEFSFTIRAYNNNQEEFRDFNITVIDSYDSSATRVYITLYGNDRLLWQDLFTTDEIKINDIFRQADSQFGLIEKPKILIVENLDGPSRDDVYFTLQDFRRTYLTLGKVEVAKAVKDNEFIYEVLYRRVYDDNHGNVLQFSHPQTSNVVTTGGIVNIRSQLLANISSSGGEDRLPLHMVSEQIIGDPSSVLGYTPMIEFAYVLPGTGQLIADKINTTDEQKKKLYLRRVRVDRIVLEPSASIDFEPQFILFDDLY